MSGRLFANPLDINNCKMYNNNSKNEKAITPEHAIVLAAIPNTTCMDYVKAVATIVGSNHIHSVHREGSRIKIYMTERIHARTVINKGVVVRGCQMNVDFLVPRSSRVILSNVDPIIPDLSLQCLLGSYGSFESAIVHQKISNEEGYSHIESSSRVVYMKTSADKIIPKKLYLIHKHTMYEIDVKVEGPAKTNRYASSQTD